MPTTNNWPLRWLMLAALLLLLPACASNLPLSPPLHVAPPAIPPLPATARQAELPSICYLTCSAGQTQRRESSRKRLTEAMQPDGSVSVLTKP